MRGLSDHFCDCLKSGFLSGITESVRGDPDLNLEIRDSYINIYYKGNSLLKLAETGSLQYKAQIHEKFLDGIDLSLDFTADTVDQFLSAIPLLKKNIAKHGSYSLEAEYEQMIIRANNFEHRNNTDYFIVDRQYVIQTERFDLIGVFWGRSGRNRNREASVCLLEVKFALNTDISEIHNQLARYHEAIRPRAAKIAEEMQAVFRQKIELGLVQQTTERLDALKTLSFSKNIDDFQFILVLVDYNPNSSLLDLESLASLPFANQIKIFSSGFAMWQQNVKPLWRHLS